jgi:hypothetical protein
MEGSVFGGDGWGCSLEARECSPAPFASLIPINFLSESCLTCAVMHDTRRSRASWQSAPVPSVPSNDVATYHLRSAGQSCLRNRNCFLIDLSLPLQLDGELWRYGSLANLAKSEIEIIASLRSLAKNPVGPGIGKHVDVAPYVPTESAHAIGSQAAVCILSVQSRH